MNNVTAEASTCVGKIDPFLFINTSKECVRILRRLVDAIVLNHAYNSNFFFSRASFRLLYR